MHTKVKTQVRGDLDIMKSQLLAIFGDEAGANKYAQVIHALLRIYPLNPQTEEPISWRDAYWSVKDIAPIDRANKEWHQAASDIGFFLEGTNVMYKSLTDMPNAYETHPDEIA